MLNDKSLQHSLGRSHSMEKRTLPESVMPNCPVLRLLKGQKAVVTGASSGIGKAVVTALGRPELMWW